MQSTICVTHVWISISILYLYIFPPLIDMNVSFYASFHVVGCVSHREWGEGQTDASKAIQGESQEDERWQDCRDKRRSLNAKIFSLKSLKKVLLATRLKDTKQTFSSFYLFTVCHFLTFTCFIMFSQPNEEVCKGGFRFEAYITKRV